VPAYEHFAHFLKLKYVLGEQLGTPTNTNNEQHADGVHSVAESAGKR